MKQILFLLLPGVLLAIENESSIFHYLRAKTYEREGRLVEAISEYKACLKSDPDSITLKKSLSYLYLQKGETKKAIKLLSEVAEKEQEIWVDIGNIYQQKKDIKRAESCFKKALKGNSFIDALYQLASLYSKIGRLEDSLVYYKKIVSISNLPEAIIGIGYLLDFQGKGTEATFWYERFLSIYPENTAILTRLSQVYLETGSLTKAKEFSERLMKLSDSAENNLLLAEILDKEKNYEEAEKCYLKAMGMKDGQAQYSFFLLRRNRIDDGLSVVNKALSNLPEDPGFLLLKGLFLLEKKDHRQAANIFTEQLELYPKNDMLYYYSGIAYDGLKERKKAEDCFKKAIKLNPKNAPALNWLGYTWADEGKNLKKAEKLIKNALVIDPDNPAYIDSLGWCYYKMEKIDEALPYLLKAVELGGDDPTIFEHIGDLYKKKGMLKEAEDFYQKAKEKIK
ncbi:MAG: tetratricopeptide repeat protein [bacterium]|nr:tetratricopeptide repeat protein [bacterium]